MNEIMIRDLLVVLGEITIEELLSFSSQQTQIKCFCSMLICFGL